MTVEQNDPLGRGRSRWELLGDVLFLIGIIAAAGVLTGHVPAQIGIALFAVGMAAGILNDPLLIIFTIILASALLALLKKVRKKVLTS